MVLFLSSENIFISQKKLFTFKYSYMTGQEMAEENSADRRHPNQ